MAYKGQELVNKLKEKGLDVAEDAAVVVVDVVFEWLVESALKSENKVDDMVAGILPVLKPIIINDFVDQIDGKDNR